MTHEERIFLLGRLHVVDLARARADAEGEAFHPFPVYTPLASGLQARAEREGDRVALLLRHPCGTDRRAEVGAAFRAFFLDAPASPRADRDGPWIVHTASALAREVPSPYEKGTQHDRDPQGDGGAVAPGPRDAAHRATRDVAGGTAGAPRP